MGWGAAAASRPMRRASPTARRRSSTGRSTGAPPTTCSGCPTARRGSRARSASATRPSARSRPRVPTTFNEEQRALLTFLLALRLDRVREFLGRHGIARYGNRADLRERLKGNLHAGTITIVDLVDFLDEVEPWSKQHVFLYNGD